LQTTVGTNYFGHYYLTHLLLDKLVQTQKEGGMARAVFMSSTFEQLGNINWDNLEYAHLHVLCQTLQCCCSVNLTGATVSSFCTCLGLLECCARRYHAHVYHVSFSFFTNCNNAMCACFSLFCMRLGQEADMECDCRMYKSQESGLFEYATAKIMKLMLSRELNKRLKVCPAASVLASNFS
jgi:NAD(P)-dependent dehydrogenase (short-subunit alcohol dehydrogenase family)